MPNLGWIYKCPGLIDDFPLCQWTKSAGQEETGKGDQKEVRFLIHQ